MRDRVNVKITIDNNKQGYWMAKYAVKINGETVDDGIDYGDIDTALEGIYETLSVLKEISKEATE